MITRAILYLRQSKDVEGTRAAVDRQLEDCQRLCHREGWTIVRTHTDNDVSASTKRTRPGYKALFADVEAGACDVIVAWAQDRLLRDVREGEDLIDLVNKHGVSVATVQGGEHDLSTSDGRMHVRLLAVIAKGEMEKKSARQKAQQVQAAERGEAPSRRLFGYRKVAGQLELDPAEAAVVREAFDRLLRGESVRAIQTWMQSTGTTTTRRRQWGHSSVLAMLCNGRYCGVRSYYGQPMKAAGKWPTIITAAEHEKAVALLSDPVRRTNHVGTQRKWLGGSLYRCHCGEFVKTSYRTDRIYTCRSGKHLSRNAEPVDQLVLRLVEARLAMPDVQVTRDRGPELEQLLADRDQLDRRLDIARDRLDRGVLDEDEYVATKRTIKQELLVVQRKIAKAAETTALAPVMDAEDRVAAFRALDVDAKRQIVGALVEVTLLPGRPGRRPFDPDTVKITWRQ